MKTILIFFFTLVNIYGYAQYVQWRDLKPGPYSVGYTVINRYDRGRTKEPKTDFEGKAFEGENAIPIQISMWYPANPDNKSVRMTYGEYVYITRQKENFRPLTEEEKVRAYDVIRFPVKFGEGIELTDQQLNSIYKTPTASVRDAPRKKGSFPVIISGTDGGPHSLNVLYEYLASKGYIVLSSPTIDRDGTLQASSPHKVLIDRIDNLEYLYAMSHEIAEADRQRIGLLGVNFEGLSALLCQMKDMTAEAVVTIDGWEGKNNSEQTVTRFPFFDNRRLRVPYMTFQQHEPAANANQPDAPKVFEGLVYSDRYYYVLEGMTHSHLIGGIGALPDLSRAKASAYKFMFTSIGNLFDAFVKKDESALSFLMRSAAENGFSANIIASEFKVKAFPPVPTSEEFEKIIMSSQFDKAKKILTEAMTLNPDVMLIDQNALSLYSFRFRQRNELKSVVAIRELGVIAFPKSAEVMEQLGDALLAAADESNARKAFEQALLLIDGDEEMPKDSKDEMKTSIKSKIKL